MALHAMLESHDTDGWHLHWSTAGTMWKVNHGLTGLTLLSMSSPGIRGRLWRCAPCEKDWDFETLSLLQHCYCYCHCYYEYCFWKVVMHRARIPSAEGQRWKGVREVSWYFQNPIIFASIFMLFVHYHKTSSKTAHFYHWKSYPTQIPGEGWELQISVRSQHCAGLFTKIKMNKQANTFCFKELCRSTLWKSMKAA